MGRGQDGIAERDPHQPVKRLAAPFVALMLLVSACSTTAGERVVVGAGTTVVDSGLIEYLIDAYIRDGGTGGIDVIALSSLQSLAYASAGNADITITHEKASLASFLSETPGAVSSPLFTSRFVYVAPPGLTFPNETVEGILSSVASDGIVFVSRDDGSGTYAKEVAMWDAAGIDPTGKPWYVRTGTGMGETLLVTDQRDGVTLSELGAYLAAADALSLVPIDDGTDPDLDNPYDVTVVAPQDNAAAAELFAWLTSEPGRAAIIEANEKLFGAQVYRLP